MKKIVRQVVREHGWSYRAKRGTHPALLSPDGKHIVVLSGTSAYGRATANLIADLKRKGAEL